MSAPKYPVQPPPPGWTADGLTDFLEKAYRNRHNSFVHMRGWTDKLIAIDECFLTIMKDWRVLPEVNHGALLFLRAHASFRGACEHVLSGQVIEAYPLIRAALEYAGYALHAYRNPGTEEIWWSRHDDEESLRAQKAEFTIKKVRESIGAANRKAEEVFRTLYERCINFGAHPNPFAVSSSMRISEAEGERHFAHVYFHDSCVQLEASFKTLCQAGICCLEILQEIFQPRFELLGVRHRILELRDGL